MKLREQMMTPQIDGQAWIYVMVQNPESDDRIVGQLDAENGVSFIPVFLDKASATQGMLHLAKERGHKYEIQAIIFEDLERYAAESRFLLFVLNDEGEIIDKRTPYQAQQ
jgi:hypothetical protein